MGDLLKLSAHMKQNKNGDETVSFTPINTYQNPLYVSK